MYYPFRRSINRAGFPSHIRFNLRLRIWPVLLATFLLSFSFSNAWAAGGTVSGTVTDSIGEPANGALIVLHQQFEHPSLGPIWMTVAATTPTSGGTYSTPHVEPGIYRLEAVWDNQSIFYNNVLTVEEAVDIVVVADEDIGNINFQFEGDIGGLPEPTPIPVFPTPTPNPEDPYLDTPGQISGTVVNGKGNPSAGVPVTVYVEEFDFWSRIETTYTDEEGYYITSPLYYKAARIKFGSELPYPGPEDFFVYYPGASSLESAANITVTPGTVMAGIDVQLSRPGTIAGSITDSEGAPIGNVRIGSYQLNQFNQWSSGAGTLTDGNGTYVLSNLQEGIVRIEFSTENYGSNEFLPEFYDDVPTIDLAADILVSLDTEITGINAQLARKGRISGRVTDIDGMPIENLPVAWYRADEFGQWYAYDQVYTDMDGMYTISRLPTANIRLRFGPESIEPYSPFEYATEYYSDASDVYSATDIAVVSDADITGIDAVLANSTTISGHITDISGAPLSSIDGNRLYNLQVRAYGLDVESCCPGWSEVGYGYVDTDGFYSIVGLPAGRYRVGMTNVSQEFHDEYYPDAETVDGGTDITLAMGQEVTGIDMQMDRFSTISGQVTTINNASYNELRVQLYRKNADPCCEEWEYIEQKYFYYQGATFYLFKGLVPGTYRVGFFTDGGFDGTSNYQTEYFDSVAELEDATDIVVGKSHNVTDINATLKTLGSISGNVSDSEGVPLAGITVLAKEWIDEGNIGYWRTVERTATLPNGSYFLPGLEKGNYRIEFYDTNTYEYGREYYDDVATIDDAIDIAVDVGQNIIGIDALLGPAIKISGQVVGLNENPIPSAYVTLHKLYHSGDETPLWDLIALVDTNENGEYSFTERDAADGTFTPGIYRVCFDDDRYGGSNDTYMAQCYDDASDIDAATDIVVGMNESVFGIDAVMLQYGAVTGVVSVTATAGERLLLADVWPTVYRYDISLDEWVDSGNEQRIYDFAMNEDGSYRISQLIPGRYRIQFAAGESFKSPFYGDAETIDDATDIVVEPGQSVPAVNIVLAQRTAVLGTVTDERGIPLLSIFVGAYRQVGLNETVTAASVLTIFGDERWVLVRSSVTDVNGKYVIYDLPEGSYRVQFTNSNGLYHSEFYGEQAFYISEAWDISVGPEMQVEDVGTQLAGITFNVAPLAVADEIAVDEAGESTELVGLRRSLLTNDADAENALLTAKLVESPINGAVDVNPDGTFAYIHDGSETVSDAFAYVASDGINTSNITTVSITVKPRNDVPIAVADTINIAQGSTATVLLSGENSLLSNDSDAEGDQLTAILIQEPASGTVTLEEDGTFVYSHVGGNGESDSFTYKVSDGQIESEPVNVTIQIDTPVGTEEPGVEESSTEGPDVNEQAGNDVLEPPQNKDTDESADDMIIYLPMVQ